MTHAFTTSYLKDSLDVFHSYKRLGEKAIEQCPDAKLLTMLDAESNSIATIVKHMAGNMKSRWVNFLTSDGEKPDRNRETEFETPPQTRAELMEMWERGWKHVFDALEPLTDADLTRTVTIRSEPHSVMQAINRQISHYSYHTGQIAYLAKHFAGEKWTTLTVPKKKSAEFNAKVAAGQTSSTEKHKR
jgi:hypothetical protein